LLELAGSSSFRPALQQAIKGELIMLYNYTDLLGPELIVAGFTLIDDNREEFIYLNESLIKKCQVNKYSLKTIKHWCRLYLKAGAKTNRIEA